VRRRIEKVVNSSKLNSELWEEDTTFLRKASRNVQEMENREGCAGFEGVWRQ